MHGAGDLLAAAPAAFLPAIGLYALFCVIPLLLLLAQTLPAAFDAKRVWAADKTFNALAKGAVRAGLEAVFLPCSGANAANAVGKALWRSATHSRRLLQWNERRESVFLQEGIFSRSSGQRRFSGLCCCLFRLRQRRAPGLCRIRRSGQM